MENNAGAGYDNQTEMSAQEKMAKYPGAIGPIGEDAVKKAYEVYKKYESGRKGLVDRIVNAEEWWKNNHWERFKQGTTDDGGIKPVSAWLFNSLINKHADFMDNYPSPAILPREQSDEDTAKVLSEVVPVILEQNGFAETYSDCCWDKPKTGTGIYGVVWNRNKENGLGDVEITHVDILNITWEPGIKKIQDSKNIFVTCVMDVETLVGQYPFLKGEITGGVIDQPKYKYEQENKDTADKVTVFDWYYKKQITTEQGTKNILHYCKFVDGHVLYATENEPRLVTKGWYDHGEYPFVFDVMFPEKGSPAGFGYLDVMVNPQEYIDRLDQVILKNALMNKPRYFVSNGATVNLDEFTDLSKDLVTVNGNVDDTRIKQIQVPQMSDVVFTQREAKVNELKETSGNRDFSQGSTTSGVTAASAIAALQEAGSKLSRDMLKCTYMAHEKVVKLVIELIRQFYDLPRCYRIVKPNGQAEYIEFTNEGMAPQESPGMIPEEMSVRKPVFDIKVSAQKASPYSRIAQNELAKELFGMGLFNPQISDQAKCVVRMMDFDRKDEVMTMIEQNGTMYMQMQQMAAVIQQMAEVIAKSTGDTRVIQAIQDSGMIAGAAKPGITEINPAAGTNIKTDTLGRAVRADNSRESQARERTAASTEVKS